MWTIIVSLFITIIALTYGLGRALDWIGHHDEQQYKADVTAEKKEKKEWWLELPAFGTIIACRRCGTNLHAVQRHSDAAHYWTVMVTRCPCGAGYWERPLNWKEYVD